MPDPPQQRDAFNVLRQFLVAISTLLLLLTSLLFLFLGTCWLYVFLATDYRAHLWKWGVGAGTLALLISCIGFLTTYHLCRWMRKSKNR